MKNLLGWLCDPYLHVILIGLVLVGLAMRPAPNEPTRSMPALYFCQNCLDFHEGWQGGCQLADLVADLMGKR